MADRRRVYVALRGGLGNQLFQYAAAAGLAGPDGVRVLSTGPTAHLSLAELAPTLPVAATMGDRLRLGIAFGGGNLASRVGQRLLRPMVARARARTLRQGEELADAFAPPPADIGRVRVLHGYFHHPDWFAGSLVPLAERLLLDAPHGWSIASDDTVLLVVRGGDYRTAGWAVDLSYYERALRQLGSPTNVHLISDDAEFAGELAQRLDTQGVQCSPRPGGGSAVDDFWAIAAARTVVMSNSTFCWWATAVGDVAVERAGGTRTVLMPRGWVQGHGDELARPGWHAV